MDVLTEEGLEHFASLVKKDINTKANTDSPILTGTPEAPTPGSSATSTQIATVGYIDKSINNVNTAVEKAQSTADSALTNAKNAQEAAENAQSTANDAVNTAESASDKSETAIETANEALYVAQTAAGGDYAPEYHASQSTKYGLASGSLFGHVMLVDYATDSYGVDSGVAVAPSALFDINTNASEAKTTADQALQNSETALTISNVNTESIITINDDITNVKQYESVGEVDLNDYYYEFAKIYVTSGSLNLPSSTESFFVDVNVDSDVDIVRQFATGAATGSIYIRMGTLIDDDDVVLDKTNGTVVVNGDLSANIYVNGNVKVSGTISGIVNASGSISYGSLTGIANANADITVGNRDIQVDGGNLTFDSNLTYNSDDYSEDDYGDLYTDGTITNDSVTTTIIYCNIIAETDSEYAFYNMGNLTVDDGGYISATNENNAGYGVYNNDGATFIVDGSVYGYAPEDSYAVYGTFTGDGAVYANDEEYYTGDNGDDDEPDDGESGGDSGYIVTWENWKHVGGNFMPTSGGIFTGDVEIANGVNVTSAEDSEGVVINGLIITSNGHIKLASGIEFY